MSWKTIDSFPYPTKEFNYQERRFLLYSKETGQVIGRCILLDEDTKDFSFTYSSESWEIKPTHWQEMQPDPVEGSAV